MPLTLQQQLALARLGASASGNTGLGSGLGDVSTGLGALRGYQSGTTTGDISGTADLAKLGTTNIPGAGNSALGALGLSKGAVGDINMGATGALDALSVYQGLQRGGVEGYGQAAGAGLQGAGLMLGNPALTTAGGAILAPLDTYEAVKNWQSGNTGSDALAGAEAGAAWGSLFGPIGTGVGAVIGGAAGALSSAFGGGRRDPESTNWNSMASAYNKNPNMMEYVTPAQAYQGLAGVMDAKNNSPGHSQPIEQVFGRMGEGNMMDQMTNYINSQVASGAIAPNESMSDQWTKTIAPWLQSKGAGIANQNTSSGQAEGPALTSDIQSLLGAWESGNLTNKSQVGSSGQTISGLPNWLGTLPGTPSIQSTHPQASPAEIAATNAATAQFRGQTAPTVASMSAPTNAPMAQANEFGLHAEGGHMKKHKSGLDALWELYAGPHFTERQNFDDGGDVGYVDYSPPPQTSNPYAYGYVAPPTPMAGLTDSQINDLMSKPVYDQSGDTPPSISGGGSGTESGHTVSGDLQNLLKNLTGNGLYGVAKSAGALAPLAALLMRSNTNIARPQGVPGMTAGASPPPAPMFNRTQNAAPSNTPSGGPMSLQDWYTYGSRPEASFFSNNQLPMAQMTGVSHARGGALSHLAHQEPDGDEFGMPEFDSAIEHHAQGPGDGTSDNIPAQLSDGEYVMDANTVSLLGNGSNKAGAQQLDQLRENLRKHAAGPMSKGKQFMKAKPPQSYMGKAKKVAGAR